MAFLLMETIPFQNKANPVRDRKRLWRFRKLLSLLFRISNGANKPVFEFEKRTRPDFNLGFNFDTAF